MGDRGLQGPAADGLCNLILSCQGGQAAVGDDVKPGIAGAGLIDRAGGGRESYIVTGPDHVDQYVADRGNNGHIIRFVVGMQTGLHEGGGYFACRIDTDSAIRCGGFSDHKPVGLIDGDVTSLGNDCAESCGGHVDVVSADHANLVARPEAEHIRRHNRVSPGVGDGPESCLYRGIARGAGRECVEIDVASRGRNRDIVRIVVIRADDILNVRVATSRDCDQAISGVDVFQRYAIRLRNDDRANRCTGNIQRRRRGTEVRPCRTDVTLSGQFDVIAADECVVAHGIDDILPRSGAGCDDHVAEGRCADCVDLQISRGEGNVHVIVIGPATGSDQRRR